MKTLKNLYGIIIASAVCLLGVSCADENDWDVDSTYNRLFSISSDKLDVSTGDTWAEVTFTGISGSEYYIIEVSTDSLYDDIPLGGTEGSIVYGEDGSITSSPDTLQGLQGDTSYFLRIKALSSTVAESNWTYYDDGNSFKTDAEQIFLSSEITRGDTYINLVWTAGAEVTHLTVTAPDGTETRIDLDAEAIESGTYTLDGLSPTTTYTIVIYNGESKRGTLSLTTMASMPTADYLYTLDASVTVITQDLLDQIAEEAKADADDPNNYSVTIGIAAGTTVDVYGIDSETGDQTSVVIPDGMSVTFFGLAGGDSPVMNFVKSIDIGGTHSYIRFENVQLVDGGCQYFINQSDATTIGGDLSFTDCTLSDFERSIIRMQGDATKTINEVNIDNCVATNMSYGNGYSVLYWNNAAYTVNTVNITNSTFDTFARSYLEVTNSNTGAINISDCTFYNGPASSRYFIDGNNCTALNVNLARCIFALSPDPTNCRGIRGASSLVIEEVYFTNDFVLTASAFTPTVQLSYSSSEIFADPENGDFTITVRDVDAGDPRWLE